ncbi:hypothetical protein, partial [uncultured Hymenobacter sp.]|uniref:hypothetical protein n=1 Tax=uncultured Hymenobacter sp. TaxID=170016 RepID=UPI0035CC35D7
QARDLTDASPAGNYVAAIRTSEELKILARIRGKGYKTLEILPVGARLSFLLSSPNDETTESYAFHIELREPLHIYAPLHNVPDLDGDIPKDYGKLLDCRCVVLPLQNAEKFPYAEPVFADSVNEAIKNAHVHYFGNSGSPGRSAFNVCHVASSPGPKLRWMRSIDLHDLREQVAPELWKQEV